MQLAKYEPGMRVRLTQRVPRQSLTSTITVEGTIVRSEQQPTGSWYAHSKGGRLWLDRLELRRDDGEIVVCNLDQYTTVEVVTGD